MKNLTIIKEARQLAENLIAQARENEPLITADLQSIAETIFAEIIGLENKFKTKESLTQKLLDTALLSSEPLEQIAENTNDALRYTFVLPFENYNQKFQSVIKQLQIFGCQIPKQRIWNAWQTAGKWFDKGYRGINITAISSQKQNFELQFHTAESYRLKTETHSWYKESRSKNTSAKRRSDINGMLKKAAENIKRPAGV